MMSASVWVMYAFLSELLIGKAIGGTSVAFVSCKEQCSQYQPGDCHTQPGCFDSWGRTIPF